MGSDAKKHRRNLDKADDATRKAKAYQCQTTHAQQHQDWHASLALPEKAAVPELQETTFTVTCCLNRPPFTAHLPAAGVLPEGTLTTQQPCHGRYDRPNRWCRQKH